MFVWWQILYIIKKLSNIVNYLIINFDLGGASGIGKGYAMEMAKEGFNILIVDKNEHDTNETRKKIESFGVKCSGFIYDFGNLGTPSAASEFLAALNTGLWWINQPMSKRDN